MTVNVKFNCCGFADSLREGQYELSADATISELMELICNESDVELADSVRANLIFLLDNRPADWSTTLSNGNVLRVLTKILGG